MTQNFARVVDGIVVEVAVIPDDLNISDCYHEDVASTFISCDASVLQGYIYIGDTFSEPVAPPVTNGNLIAYASAKRYAIETGGIVINGSLIATDRASQSLITGAYNYVKENPDATVNFKAMSGFVELTAAQMVAIANVVAAHVQACFAAEGIVVGAIASGAITTTAEIDAAAWPLTS